MKCKYCGCLESKVVDSRMADGSTSIRRRRECVRCGKRFTTQEIISEPAVYVIKKGGGRQEFDVQKIRSGIVKACEKRPISISKIDNLMIGIENKIRSLGQSEIPSEKIGDIVMDAIKDLDDVAYVRYASVYKEFKDIDTFMKEISEILNKKKNG